MQEDLHSLAPGTLLNSYRIIRILGEGGFGITYLAEDTQLGLRVVIKEYFPNEFAMRTGHSSITAKSTSLGDFSRGMKRFKEEAQTLARFNHPSIVKILGYFEANDTAYFVMEYEEGVDLSHYLKEKGTLGQEEVLSIIMPILEGLKEVHAHNFLHRDIKPGNILLRANKSPVLIDFGASKQAVSETSKSVTSMLTEGYAPLEQYSTDIKQQGPWTDLYAVGAVIYRMITGEVPPSAQTRSYQLLQEGSDPYRPLMEIRPGGFDENFLRAVDRALALKAKERPQNVQEFQDDIAGELARSNTREHHSAPETPRKRSSRVPVMIAAGLALLLLGGGAFVYLKPKGEPSVSRTAAVETPQTPAPQATSSSESGKVEESEASSPATAREKSEAQEKSTHVSEAYRKGREALKGEGVPRNPVKARDLFRQAISEGDSRGFVGLGLLYLTGKGVDKDYAQAHRLFEKACDGGVADGCYNLGKTFAKGIGDRIDPTAALRSYERACQLGSAGGCYRAGMRYLTGKDISTDLPKARKLLTDGCQKGSGKACTALGVAYIKGEKSSRDYGRAAEAFRQACDEGNGQGCYNLGRLYEKGRGVSRDASMANDLYRQACDHGYKKGCNKRALSGEATLDRLREPKRFRFG